MVFGAIGCNIRHKQVILSAKANGFQMSIYHPYGIFPNEEIGKDAEIISRSIAGNFLVMDDREATENSYSKRCLSILLSDVRHMKIFRLLKTKQGIYYIKVTFITSIKFLNT